MTWRKALKGFGAYKAYRYLKESQLPSRGQDYLLERFGFQRRNPAATVFGGIGFFGLGVLVGSALGVMFAPMKGDEMRNTIREQGMKGVMDKTRATMPATPSA